MDDHRCAPAFLSCISTVVDDSGSTIGGDAQWITGRRTACKLLAVFVLRHDPCPRTGRWLLHSSSVAFLYRYRLEAAFAIWVSLMIVIGWIVLSHKAFPLRAPLPFFSYPLLL